VQARTRISAWRRSGSGTALVVALVFLAGCGGGGSDAPALASGAPGTAAAPGAAPAPAPGSTPAPAAGATPAPATAPGGTPAPASPDATIKAGAACSLSYTLTASPLLDGADPLLGQQWHLTNTGQAGGTAGEDLRVAGAWMTTRGAGARVAVIDDSIEVLHPDLRPNLVDGASLSYRSGNVGSVWPVPCSADESHGTAVAGLVAARDGNARGGAGVAPRAALVAYDALASGLDVDVADALTRSADANLIYHNSWGAPDNGALHASGAVFDAAIQTGLATGRAGRGSVYVFSAGNGGCYARRRPSGACMDDNSNFDGYVNGRGIIAVCAVDGNGRRPTYGEPGANLTVCAPSSGAGNAGVTTTALQGGYRTDFTGTSAAAPMVSGVVALMLSANPSLTWRDVRLILAGTARQNDPTDADWAPLAYGYRFNHKYGFGVADAQAAVAAAASWVSLGGSATQRSCGPYSRSPGLAIQDPLSGVTPQPVTDAIAVTGCAITQIEWVELRLTAPHAYSGDLRLRLTSPNGLVSRLADARACDGGCGSYADWRFGSARHLGEPANGSWTLEVADMIPVDIGTLQNWSITFHGR
jgi:proprotein convertase subtilisin/kexin type 2